MSPGGSIFRSSRRRPDEPPSSVTVTTADNSRTTHRSDGPGGGGACGPGALPIRIPRLRSGVATYRFSPRSRVDNPVPPPMATTRSSFSFVSVKFGNDMPGVPFPSLKRKLLQPGFQRSAKKEVLDLRIKQLRKARIVRHVLKVRVRTRLNPISRILPDRLRQMLETLM